MLRLRHFCSLLQNDAAASPMSAAAMVPVNGCIVSKRPFVQAILEAAARSGMRFVDSAGEAVLLHATSVHYLELLCVGGVKVLCNLSATKHHEKAARLRQGEIKAFNALCVDFLETLDARSAEDNEEIAAQLAILDTYRESHRVKFMTYFRKSVSLASLTLIPLSAPPPPIPFSAGVDHVVKKGLRLVSMRLGEQ